MSYSEIQMVGFSCNIPHYHTSTIPHSQLDYACSTIPARLFLHLMIIFVPASNQRSSSEQSLDFLKTDNSKYLSANAKVIGKHMTKEDLLYEPAPANTNPFASNAQLCAGRKLVASEMERQQMLELSMTLPLAQHRAADEGVKARRGSTRHLAAKQSHSLPDNIGIVQKAIAQFDAQISSSHRLRRSVVSPTDKLFSSGYASGESSCEGSLSSHNFVRRTSKQRNLECAMLFCGLDLIQMHRASSSEWSDTHMSTDLESEFQDDLEDVLRQSKWNPEDCVMPQTPDSVFSDLESDQWFAAENQDSATSRYLHPTLVEKRKQLRRVESRRKEKIEQLQIKLEQLRITTKINLEKQKKQRNNKGNM